MCFTLVVIGIIGPYPGGAQSFALALCSVITLSSVWGTICSGRDRTESVCAREVPYLMHCISSPHSLCVEMEF